MKQWRTKMKYSEFKEYLRLNDISLKEDEEKLIADDQFEISKKREQTIWFLAGFIDSPYEYEMLKKAIELAETPLDEREEVKKYYIKHKFINFHTAVEYINLSITEEVTLDNRHEDPHYKTKFTKAEIEELKARYDTDLRDFEIIEVEEA